MSELEIPKDFRGIVVTLPPDLGTAGIVQLQRLVEDAQLDDFKGHRILHLHQVKRLDSAAVATLVDMVDRVRKQGYEVALCEPPPVVRSYLDIYGANRLLQGSVLSSYSDGTYESELVPFVPPFVPEPKGRIDVYAGGKVRSFLMGKELSPTSAVNLAGHPRKTIARASTMAVKNGESAESIKELTAASFVLERRHMCGCSATHSTFDSIYKLHQWYRGKGFDFVSLELLASDEPAGIVTERLAFRDRGHHGQFETLLKIDTSWNQMARQGHEQQDEFYYQYI